MITHRESLLCLPDTMQAWPDTAGRLHIDDELMKELEEIKGKVNPDELLLVADAMTGQDAVNVAKRFDEDVGLSGVILSKMEDDARGGAGLESH